MITSLCVVPNGSAVSDQADQVRSEQAVAAQDVVFIAMENWDDVPRRFQPLARHVAQRHPADKVLFVGLPRNLSHAVWTFAFGDLAGPSVCPADGCGNIWVVRSWKLLPDTVPFCRRVNQFVYRATLRRSLRRLGVAAPVLWINPHWAEHVVGRIGEAAAVYDIGDDWTAFPQSDKAARLVRQQDAALCAKADAVVVVSDRLLQLKRAAGREPHLIPNGVDAAPYATASPDPQAATETGRWRRPILGYTGTVHPDRVDVELVRAVAQRWPGSVVLVGPDQLPPADRARLSLTNVHRIRPVAAAAVPGVMAAFDACIVPHRMTAFTDSLNPLKLWEYLATGKPIVATDVAGFRDFPDLVRLARTADEFVDAAHAAVAEGPTRSALRQAVARANSWDRRVDEVERVIRDCVRRRAADDARRTTALRDGPDAG